MNLFYKSVHWNLCILYLKAGSSNIQKYEPVSLISSFQKTNFPDADRAVAVIQDCD